MNFRSVLKWIGYIVGIVVVLYILILGVLIYFLASGDFKNSLIYFCLLYTSPSPRDVEESRMPSSA